MNPIIIAEMAWSHNGSLDNAKNIALGAKNAGAHYLSIHLTSMKDYMVPDYRCEAGTTLSESADSSLSIYEFLDQLNLSQEEWFELGVYCEKIGIPVVAMCNDEVSFQFSKKMNIEKYVIPASSFDELDFISDVAQYCSSLILRTGGATIDEVESVLRLLEDCAAKEVILLGGIQLYPTPVEDMHLRSLAKLSRMFNSKTLKISMGLADHVDGGNSDAKYLPALALPLGVFIFEKHITIDRKFRHEDYEAALGISEFKEFCDFLNTAQLALGDGTLEYMQDNDNYKKYRLVHRRKIVFAHSLSKGSKIKRSDLTRMRSDAGAPSSALSSLVGKILKEDVDKFGAVTPDVFEP